MAKNWSIESRITPQERNARVCFRPLRVQKNAKLGLDEKLVFEKNDILGQNLGQNRGKKSLPKNKLFAAISRKL